MQKLRVLFLYRGSSARSQAEQLEFTRQVRAQINARLREWVKSRNLIPRSV